MSEQIVKIYASQDWVIENTVKSWNDLEDKPFGEIIDLNEVNATYASGVVTIENGNASIKVGTSNADFLKQEASYYVEWDGVMYAATYHGGIYGIGNISIYYGDGENDTGEPFFICQGMSPLYLDFIATTDGEHTYKIYTSDVAINQLDEKYIPDTIARVEDLDAEFSNINTSITNITNGDVTVKKAEEANHATSANTATSATTAGSATKATQDASGNVITSTYETKSDATAKLNEAKSYADTAAVNVKNDLLNGAGSAYDTLKELGDLIDVNVDAIDALEIVAANKADKVHNHDDIYYTETEIDTKLDGKVPISRTINGKALSSNITLTAADVGACGLPEFESMELITIDDIDAICGASIQAASAEGVKF